MERIFSIKGYIPLKDILLDLGIHLVFLGTCIVLEIAEEKDWVLQKDHSDTLFF